MIPKRLKPLTMEEWVCLTDKERWDCIVALRGPDLIESQTVKYFTSSIIRWKLSKITRVGGLINDSVPFLIIPDKPPSGNWDGSHFFNHIQEAALILHIPVAIIPLSEWEALKGTRADYGFARIIQLLETLSLPPQAKEFVKQWKGQV